MWGAENPRTIQEVSIHSKRVVRILVAGRDWAAFFEKLNGDAATVDIDLYRLIAKLILAYNGWHGQGRHLVSTKRHESPHSGGNHRIGQSQIP